MNQYALDNDAAQTPGRFNVLEDRYDPHTRDCLERLGIGAGWRCLEIGAGGGSVAAWMADRVGPTGSVLATDVKPRLAAESARPNLTPAQHDVTTDALPDSAFDLVHARLVLIHLQDRREALARIVAALKPGGHLLLEEFDCSWTPVLRSPYPEAEALFTTVNDAFVRRLESFGADHRWGRKVFAAMAETGLVEMGSRTFAEAWDGGGTGIGLYRYNTEQLAPELLRDGVSEEQLTRFWALLEHPGFTVNSYPLVSVWGRRSGR
ncbi:class I SAM-dependent methyltransferase [Glycomyces sp. NPDC048151]|uniref:class I SAM-dependent methyltransferase n=1 Tax=Glycomyces sp. NPDC048151 TaxID=3364002 RepID=UPI00371616CF